MDDFVSAVYAIKLVYLKCADSANNNRLFSIHQYRLENITQIVCVSVFVLALLLPITVHRRGALCGSRRFYACHKWKARSK